MFGGGVNMRQEHIYIKKTLKNRKNDIQLGGGGSVVYQQGGWCLYPPPRGGVKISLIRYTLILV